MTRVVIVWIRMLCLSIWIGGIGVIVSGGTAEFDNVVVTE